MVSIAVAAKSHGQCRQATSTDLVVGCCHIFSVACMHSPSRTNQYRKTALYESANREPQLWQHNL